MCRPNAVRKVILLLISASSLAIVLACTLPSLATPTPTRPTATPTVGPTPTVAPTATEPPPAGTPEGPCTLTAEETVEVYERPYEEAAIFGELSPGFTVTVVAKTADEWYGFEPGVAQAPNVGVFRLRWIQETSAIQLEGNCEDLRQVIGPPPGVCFTMPMAETNVYMTRSTSAPVITTMEYGDFAAVLSRDPEWALLDLSVGNVDLDTTGWVQEESLNLNGPCDRLLTPEAPAP